MLLLLALRMACIARPVSVSMLDTTEALTAFLAELMSSIHPGLISTSLYQQDICTAMCAGHRSID